MENKKYYIQLWGVDGNLYRDKDIKLKHRLGKQWAISEDYITVFSTLEEAKKAQKEILEDVIQIYEAPDNEDIESYGEIIK